MLARLDKYNLHLKLPKCEFLKSEVVSLSLAISAEGFRPGEDKINAVKKAPTPQNVSELRSSVGMFQCYHSFFARVTTNVAFAEDYSMGMDR